MFVPLYPSRSLDLYFRLFFDLNSVACDPPQHSNSPIYITYVEYIKTYTYKYIYMIYNVVACVLGVELGLVAYWVLGVLNDCELKWCPGMFFAISGLGSFKFGNPGAMASCMYDLKPLG